MVGWMGGGKHRVRGGIHVVEGRVCVCVCVLVDLTLLIALVIEHSLLLLSRQL